LHRIIYWSVTLAFLHHHGLQAFTESTSETEVVCAAERRWPQLLAPSKPSITMSAETRRTSWSLSEVLFLHPPFPVSTLPSSISKRMPTNELPIRAVSAGDILAANIVLPIVAMIIVSLRFWMRTSRKMGLGIDDWLILVALVSNISVRSTGDGRLNKVPRSSLSA
jgi:hypothetical protein